MLEWKEFEVKEAKSDEKSDEKKGEKHSSESRQRWILKQLKLNGKVFSRNLVDFFNIHKDTAIEDLNKMINENIIKKEGTGRNTYYTLK